ncbi:MAG TPA: TolC family protein [Phaeodactylibacter sp.]|nr:TolC family protein [Phaeodactylibacter sp.]
MNNCYFIKLLIAFFYNYKGVPLTGRAVRGFAALRPAGTPQPHASAHTLLRRPLPSLTQPPAAPSHLRPLFSVRRLTTLRILTMLLLGVLLCTSQAPAQSIQELWQEARKQNLKLQYLHKDYLAALEKVPQVGQLPDPVMGLGIFPLPVETRLGPQVLRIGATQMLPWKGLLAAKEDVEQSKARAIAERVEVVALELYSQLRKNYYQLYRLQKSQDILQSNIALLESLENLALAKVESGNATAADVLRTQIKIEEIRQEILLLENEKTKPRVAINRLLNRDLDTPVYTLDTLSMASIALHKDSLLAHIQAEHPLLRMMEQQQQLAHQAIALNRLNEKPSFGIGLDYILVNKRKDAEPSRNGRDILQLRATVKIPFNKTMYRAKESEEKIKIAALDDRKDDALQQFMANIEMAFADFRNSELRFQLYQKQKEITQASIKILQANYSSSGKNFDELLRLENDLIDYDLKILDAIVQSHTAIAEVERYVPW